MTITPEEVFFAYMKAKAKFQKRPYSEPKHWDKIKKRRDWMYFIGMSEKAEGQLALVDLEQFFDANFQLRDGRFAPRQFYAPTSYQLYHRWLSLPKNKPDIEQLAVSCKWLVQYLKKHEVTFEEYFEKSQVYPLFLQHHSNGRLHRWILAYYFKNHRSAFHKLQNDVVEHSIGASKDDLSNLIDVWWMQLINEEKSHSIVKRFIDLMEKSNVGN